MATISIIAAMSENHVIGNNGTIPWHIKEDFKLFKYYTNNKTIIMGRKTWDSLPKKPLPNRRNIVITHNLNQVSGECEIVSSFDQALKKTQNEDEVFIIGGQTLYKQALPFAKYLYLSHVKINCEGDTFFPKFDKNNYSIIEEEKFEEFTFKLYKFIY